MALAVLACAAFWIFVEPRTQAANSVVINGKQIELEVVESFAAITKGLGERDSLDREAGMLFVLPFRGIHTFWMKGMRFPLDIIWLDDGTVVDMVSLDPPTPESPQPETHRPAVQADSVLELNAGMAAELGIKQGLKLDLPR